MFSMCREGRRGPHLPLLLAAAGDAPLVLHKKQSESSGFSPLCSTSRGESRRAGTMLQLEYVYFKVFCQAVMFLWTLSWSDSAVKLRLKLGISWWLENLCEIQNDKSDIRTQL